MVMASISSCGHYRITPATIGDAYTVLSDLSRDEAEEGQRLGITSFSNTYEEVANGRCYAVRTTARPYKTLVIFGANPDGAIWLLPSQYCVECHGRMLASKRICQWFIEHAFSLVPAAPALFNCVTPAGTKIINWLKRSAGARFADKPTPTKLNGALALTFRINRPSENVAGAASSD